MKVNLVQPAYESKDIIDACIAYLENNYNNLTCAVSVLSWSKLGITKLVVQVYDVSGDETTFNWFVPTQLDENTPVDVDKAINSFRLYVDLAAYIVKHKKKEVQL